MKLRMVCLFAVGCLAAACRSTTHWTTTPPTVPQTLKEFDITWPRPDDNGFPLNPEWGSQRQSSTLPMTEPNDACALAPQQCTTQLRRDAIDEAPRPSLCRFGVDTHIDNAGPFAAHVNWAVSTYTGTVRPSVPPISDDLDFNFEFLPDGGSGLTHKNSAIAGTQKKYVELELDSTEVGERFGLDFWRTYADDAGTASCTDINAVEGSECAAKRDAIEHAWVRGGHLSRAVVIGLFGVDCEHGCKSEVHPVFALAVEMSSGVAAGTVTRGNQWAIFARNWGNEGFCSTHAHEVDTRYLTLLIPPPPGSSAPPAAITNAQFAYSGDRVGSPSFRQTTSGAGLLVTFELPDSGRHGLTELLLTVDWSGSTTVDAIPVAAPPRSATAYSAASFAEYVNAEVNRLPDTRGLRTRTRRRLDNMMGKRRTIGVTRVDDAHMDKTIRPNGALHFAVAGIESPRSVKQPAKQEEILRELCKASRSAQIRLQPFNDRPIDDYCRATK